MAPQAGRSDSETILSLLIDISARLGTVDAQVTMILAEHGRASDHRKEIYKAIEEARSRIAHVGTRCDVLDALKPHVEETHPPAAERDWRVLGDLADDRHRRRIAQPGARGVLQDGVGLAGRPYRLELNLLRHARYGYATQPRPHGFWRRRSDLAGPWPQLPGSAANSKRRPSVPKMPGAA